MSKESYENISLIAKSIRSDLGITQKEFAKILNVHPMTVSKLERGDYTPNNLEREIILNLHKAIQSDQGELVEAASLLLPSVAVGFITALLVNKKGLGKLLTILLAMNITLVLQYIFYLGNTGKDRDKDFFKVVAENS